MIMIVIRYCDYYRCYEYYIVGIIVMIVIDDCHSLFSFFIQAINPYIHLFI